MSSRIKRSWNAVRYRKSINLFLYRFEATGIAIFPFYWIREGQVAIPSPDPRGDLQKCTFRFLDEGDLDRLEGVDPGHRKMSFRERFRRGMLCFAAEYEGQIAGYTWVDLEESNMDWYRVPMKANEAYLWDMYTKRSLRGLNLAPYLRYRSYKALRERGRDVFYSFSDYFNAPAVRFKEKLGAEFLWIGLYVAFWGRWRRLFVLKRIERKSDK